MNYFESKWPTECFTPDLYVKEKKTKCAAYTIFLSNRKQHTKFPRDAQLAKNGKIAQ